MILYIKPNTPKRNVMSEIATNPSAILKTNSSKKDTLHLNNLNNLLPRENTAAKNSTRYITSIIRSGKVVVFIKLTIPIILVTFCLYSFVVDV